MNTDIAIEELLHALAIERRPKKALVGFDGYIDQIKRVVKKRKGRAYDPFPSIAEFADRLAFAAGKSAQLELVSQEMKLGGNAPIMANALAQTGFQTTCIGTLGGSGIHPLFDEIPANLISLGAPAETIALEFGDGKLILSDVKAFEDLGWKRVRNTVGLERLKERFEKHELLAMVGWSNLPLANDLLAGILEHLLPSCSRRSWDFFFDLADPTAKPPERIREMVATIGAFSKFGAVTLGVNENEAIFLYQIHFEGETPPSDLKELGARLFEQLAIDSLVIHPIDRALLVTADGVVEQMGKVIAAPKIQTGAGDNLNAGYCLGLSLGVSARACLIAAIANSGAYVSLGHSPTKKELRDYLHNWLQEQ